MIPSRAVAVALPALGLALAACGSDGAAADAAPPLPDAHYPSTIECAGDVAPDGDPVLPKNIIVIMGDGMGPVQVQAGGIINGGPLALEGVSDAVYVNTDSLTTDAADVPDDEPTDSAAAATAMATGVRTANDVVGLDPDGAELETIADLAKAAGKSVGIVTNSFLYDASPAAFYAHTDNRDDHDAILTALVTDAQPDVILGGGRELFEALGGTYLNLAVDAGYFVIHDDAELAAWDPTANPMALGLFQGSAVSEAPSLWEWFTTPVALRDDTSTDPRLPAMAQRALDALDDNDAGFFLFVENEHIDTLGHIALIKRELAAEGMPLEVVEVDATVEVALAWIEQSSSFDETLLIVTADHETGGYGFYMDDLGDPSWWASPFHSRQPVAVYARGPGAENLASLCRGADVFRLMTGRLP
jgi:alkaline phosphatase